MLAGEPPRRISFDEIGSRRMWPVAYSGTLFIVFWNALGEDHAAEKTHAIVVEREKLDYLSRDTFRERPERFGCSGNGDVKFCPLTYARLSRLWLQGDFNGKPLDMERDDRLACRDRDFAIRGESNRRGFWQFCMPELDCEGKFGFHEVILGRMTHPKPAAADSRPRTVAKCLACLTPVHPQ